MASQMVPCAACGAPNPSARTACYHCGEALDIPTMIPPPPAVGLAPCPACSGAVSDAARACPHCGQPLKSRPALLAGAALLLLLVVLTAGALAWLFHARALAERQEVERVARDYIRSASRDAIRAAEAMRLHSFSLMRRRGQPLNEADIRHLASSAVLTKDPGVLTLLEAAQAALVIQRAEAEAAARGISAWQVQVTSPAEARAHLLADGQPLLTCRLEKINGAWKVVGTGE